MSNPQRFSIGCLAAALCVAAAAKDPEVLKLEGDVEGVHDPVIIRQKDTYYVFCTGGGRSGGGIIPIRTSKDLIHWSEEKSIPVMKNEPTAVNVWAPELFYDDIRFHTWPYAQ